MHLVGLAHNIVLQLTFTKGGGAIKLDLIDNN